MYYDIEEVKKEIKDKLNRESIRLYLKDVSIQLTKLIEDKAIVKRVLRVVKKQNIEVDEMIEFILKMNCKYDLKFKNIVTKSLVNRYIEMNYNILDICNETTNYYVLDDNDNITDIDKDTLVFYLENIIKRLGN